MLHLNQTLQLQEAIIYKDTNTPNQSLDIIQVNANFQSGHVYL